MNWNQSFFASPLRLFPLLLFAGLLGLAGCTPAAPLPPATATPVTNQTVTSTPTPSPSTGMASAETTVAPAELPPPVLLQISEIDMEVAISPMAWRVVESNGVRTTTWVLPESGAGWHPNSAGAGDAGNVVISGHQLLGDAPFAPIALGDIEVGQAILLTNADGEVFTYEVVEVTEPLPISNNPAAEEAIAEQYLAQTSTPMLTLISGWPDYSTTHRVIVIAQLIDADQ
ncbi:MAG: sortase [Caldilineaceae bacterium]|nr:sortase [Caldilineaceae bacterium]